MQCFAAHMQILLIEDERKLAAAIGDGLRGEGYVVAIAHSGESGARLLRQSQFDMVLLDVMLPRKGGLETLRDLRRDGFRLPVLVLTSRDAVDDRVLGLDAGADDYLVKPFAFPELLARIRALSRRDRISPRLSTAAIRFVGRPERPIGDQERYKA